MPNLVATVSEIDFDGEVAMLLGVHPVLTGELLLHLDSMGHGDGVAVVDANFPASRVAARLVQLPRVSSPEALHAVRSVVPPDDADPLDLMQTSDGSRLPIMDELVKAADLGGSRQERLLDRFDFYAAAADAYLIVRTGEMRIYGNALLRKGVISEVAGS